MSTDVEKTKAVLAKIMETEAGWATGRENPDVQNEPQTYIYLVDMRSNFMWAAAIPNRQLESMYAKRDANHDVYKALVEHLPALIRECSDGTPELSIGKDWEEWLGRAFAIHVVSGKGYETAPPKHIVFINYDLRDGTMLRPFVLGGGTRHEGVAPFDVVERLTSDVVERDRVRYPEWGIK